MAIMVGMSTEAESFDRPLRLQPQYRDYVWGGRALRPDVPGPTAEAWMIYAGDVVADGPHAGKTLAELTSQFPGAVVGECFAGNPARFPLLIKLLDCADWLSVQVHPDDEMARTLEGPQHNGKTEAWHVLHAEAGAKIACGMAPGTTLDDFVAAVAGSNVLATIRYVDMRAGDTVLIRAGTVHALGPGMMVYEVQQNSDITYRVYDWDRPASAARPLHIEKSLQVIHPDSCSTVLPLPRLAPGEGAELAQCEYFRLERLAVSTIALNMDTRGQTFHALTALDAPVRVSGAGWSCSVGKWQSLLIPAALGKYSLQAEDTAQMLCASLP